MDYIDINIIFSEEIPIYQTEGSAGIDISSNEDVKLNPGEIKAISTGIKMEIPNGYEGQVRSRSGMTLKGIIVANAPGTIDSDFRGEIKVILCNIGQNVFQITKGMRIAQMVFSQYVKANFNRVNQLNDTKRGSDGFGSTGY